MTTTGVYTLANLVINDSLLDLFLSARSTRSMIFETVLSPKTFVVFTLTTPERFMQPDMILSPTEISRGRLSPVNAAVSSEVSPSMTLPSIGTLSPGFTTIISPIATSSGDTSDTRPSLSTLATSGLIARRCEMLSLLFPSAYSSNSSPIWKNSITNTASGNSVSAPGRKPMHKAPMVAIDIRKSSLNKSPSIIPSAASLRVPKPISR